MDLEPQLTDNKFFFSTVRSSGTIRLTGKFAFVLSPFYPNQCRFLGGRPLGWLLEKPVDISHLLEAGFD